MQPDSADPVWLHKACSLAQRALEPNVVVEGHMTSMTEHTFSVLLHGVPTEFAFSDHVYVRRCQTTV